VLEALRDCAGRPDSVWKVTRETTDAQRPDPPSVIRFQNHAELAAGLMAKRVLQRGGFRAQWVGRA